MNVYEATAKSPIGVAMHEKGSAVAEKVSWLKPWDEQHPDGWQPLYAGDEVEQWKQRAEKAEAQLAEALIDLETLSNTNAELRKQLAGQYTLGEPLTEDEWDKLDDDSPIIYKTVFGHLRQSMKSHLLFVEGVRYADPRPWPVLPEPTNQESKLNAYELPIGTEIVIGKRRWELIEAEVYHPDRMYFQETTGGEIDPQSRVMYPSEVDWLIGSGAKVSFRRNAVPENEEPELFVSGLNGRNYLTDEGRRRLERLLRESEGE